MTHIPTKQEIEEEIRLRKEEERKEKAVEDFAEYVDYFTKAILGAIAKGESYLDEQTRNISPEVLAALQSEFGKSGWTISVRNARTGCYVSWS